MIIGTKVMAEIIKLFELEIDVEKATASTRATLIAIEQLRAESKRLKETEGELSDAYLENQASLKVLQTELRQNEKLTQNVIQANEANTGSIDQMRKQLAVVSVQWAKLSKDERENTEQGKRLTAQKLQLTEALKREERATGDARRNVGNYSEAMSKSIGIFGQFVPAIGQAAGAAEGLGKAFTVALGPIGLIVAAIALVVSGLKAFFTSSEEGQNAWARFSAAGSTALAKVTDALAAFGKKLLEPKQLITDLTNLFENTFGKILKGVFESISAQADRFFLTINKGYQQIKNLFTENTKGIEDVQKRIDASNERLVNANKLIVEGVNNTKQAFNDAISAIKDFANETLEAIKAAQLIADRQAALDKQTRASLVANAKDRLQIAKLKNEFAQKDILNDEQRLAKLDEIFKLEKQILDRNLSIAQQKYEIRKAQNALSNTTKEDLDEEAKLLADVYDVRAANFEKTKELEGQRAELVLKVKNDAINAQKAIEKAETDRLKAGAEAELEALNNEIKLIKELDQASLNAQEQRLQAHIIELDAEHEASKRNVFRALDLEREKLITQRAQEIEFAEKIGADTAAIRQKYANADLEIERAKTDAKLALAEGFAGNLKTIFGEQTAIGKAAAVAETTINTYRGATAAYAALAGIPVVGPALGIAAAAAAVVAGLANVKKILAVKSGLPESGAGTPSGVSASTGDTGVSNAALVAPSINQGIVSRETLTNKNNQVQTQGVLVVDSVTAAQQKQTSNSKTAII